MATVLAGEMDAIQKAVDELLYLIPLPLLLHQPSALRDLDRIRTRREHLLTCGISSTRAGSAFVRSWLSFWSTRGLPNHGMPVDVDLMRVSCEHSWLQLIPDAKRRSAGKAKQTGTSVQHATACAARWVTDHVGLPFEVAQAKLTSIRKVAAPARIREPSWASMWKPAILIHLLRVALSDQLRPTSWAMESVRCCSSAIYRHKLVGSHHVMLTPRAKAMLKRALAQTARLGLSTAALLSVDKAVIDVVHEGQSQYKEVEDGSLAIENMSAINARICFALSRPSRLLTLGETLHCACVIPHHQWDPQPHNGRRYFPRIQQLHHR